MNQADRDRIEDLGLIDDDATEDLRPQKESAPEARTLARPAGADQNHSTSK